MKRVGFDRFARAIRAVEEFRFAPVQLPR